MHVSVSNWDDCQPENSLDNYGTIDIGKSYHVKIAFNDIETRVDVTSAGTADWFETWNRRGTLNTSLGDTVPVWFMSNKYSGEYNLGNGTFSNIVLISNIFSDGDTLSPTTAEPTSSPTTSNPTTPAPIPPTTASPTPPTPNPTTPAPIP